MALFFTGYRKVRYNGSDQYYVRPKLHLAEWYDPTVWKFECQVWCEVSYTGCPTILHLCNFFHNSLIKKKGHFRNALINLKWNVKKVIRYDNMVQIWSNMWRQVEITITFFKIIFLKQQKYNFFVGFYFRTVRWYSWLDIWKRNVEHSSWKLKIK